MEQELNKAYKNISDILDIDKPRFGVVISDYAIYSETDYPYPVKGLAEAWKDAFYFKTSLISAIEKSKGSKEGIISFIIGHEYFHYVVSTSQLSNKDQKLIDNLSIDTADNYEKNESEADVLGVVLARLAGYDPSSALDFFKEKFSKERTYNMAKLLEIEIPYFYLCK